MAINNHRIVTGTQGGALGITNVGTGADVTWSGAVTTYPTFASSGLCYATADDTTEINLAASNAARGTYYAWGTQGDDARPEWATSPGYFELAVGVTGQFVQFIGKTILNALTSGQQDGLEVTFGLGLAVGASFVAGSVPAIVDAGITTRIMCSDDVGGAGTTGFIVGWSTRNAQGFHPSWGVDLVGLTPGTENRSAIVAGNGTTHPYNILPYGKFAKIRLHWDRSATATSNDGVVRVFVNDVLVQTMTGADLWVATQNYLSRICGIGSQYSAAIGGTKIRYCGPIMVRTVPVADIQADLNPPWSIQRTRGHDLQRWYAAMFANNASAGTYGAPWSISGTATLPVVGYNYSSGGVMPGRSRFVIAGTAAQTFLLTLEKDIWDGTAASDPRGNDGRVWLSFTDLYHGNNSDVTVVVPDLAGTVHTIQLKASTNSLVVDGVTLATGLDTSTRFQLALGMKAGSTCVVLYDITSTNFHGESLRVYNVANTWTAAGLGKASIAGTFAGSTSAEVGGLGVYRRLLALYVDSFVSESPTNTMPSGALSPKLHGFGSNSGAVLPCAQDITVPDCYDPIPYSGGGFSNMSIALMFARSGNRLSQFDTHMRTEAEKIPGFHGLLFAGVVNDVTQSHATLADAISNAATIETRMLDWMSMHATSGGTTIVVDPPDVEAGSMTGSWTTYSMQVPGMVADRLAKSIPEQSFAATVTHCRIRPLYHTADSIISSDGIHGSGSTAWGVQKMVYLMHLSKAIQVAQSGTNADGTVERARRPVRRALGHQSVGGY